MLQVVSLLRLTKSPVFVSYFRLKSTTTTSRNKFIQKRCHTDMELECFGDSLGRILVTGDVLLLTGDLGVGKSTFARGIVRAKFNDLTMKVTSPSYLLDNCYQYEEGKRLHHMDLYRMPPNSDLSILGIPEVFTDSLCLMEWPQRMAPKFRPESYIDVNILIGEDENRHVRMDFVGDRWCVAAQMERFSEFEVFET